MNRSREFTETTTMTITANYNGTCTVCRGAIKAGSRINWVRGVGSSHLSAEECHAAKAAQAATAAVAPKATIILAGLVAFLKGAQSSLKFPKIRICAPSTRGGELKVWIAGPAAKVPGSVQVAHNGAWIGRVEPDGGVRGRLAEMVDILGQLDMFSKDPVAGAKAYAAMTGACTYCGIRLTDAGSVEVGYGPVCAKHYGLPHKPKGTPVLAAVDAAPFVATEPAALALADEPGNECNDDAADWHEGDAEDEADYMFPMADALIAKYHTAK